MNVDWYETVCGVRMIKIRDLMRELGLRKVDLAWIATQLEIGESKAEAVVAELIDRRWIQSAEPFLSSNARYKIADDGRSLAAARAIPRITRAKAEQILKGFMRRVHDVNDDDDFGMYVREVYVFGSFLDPSKDLLGDLDLIVPLSLRSISGRKASKYEWERQELMGATGWYSDFFCHEVRGYLKARDPHISMGSITLLDMPVPKLLIYSAPPEVSNEHEHRGNECPWAALLLESGRGVADRR